MAEYLTTSSVFPPLGRLPIIVPSPGRCPGKGRPASSHSATALLRRTDSARSRSEEHTSELQSQSNLVCRLLLEKKKQIHRQIERCEHHHEPLRVPPCLHVNH